MTLSERGDCRAVGARRSTLRVREGQGRARALRLFEEGKEVSTAGRCQRRGGGPGRSEIDEGLERCLLFYSEKEGRGRTGPGGLLARAKIDAGYS